MKVILRFIFFISLIFVVSLTIFSLIAAWFETSNSESGVSIICQKAIRSNGTYFSTVLAFIAGSTGSRIRNSNDTNDTTSNKFKIPKMPNMITQEKKCECKNNKDGIEKEDE